MADMDLSKLTIPTAVIKLVDPAMARASRVVPVGFENNVLTVAVSDATNFNALDDLQFILNCEIIAIPADPSQLSDAIKRYFPDKPVDVF